MLLQGQFQNAYVTRSLERAIATLRDRFGAVDIKQFEASIEVKTPHGTGPAAMKTALAWVGEIQYELIEPVSGFVDIYRDALRADDGLQFHHICMRPDDLQQVRAEIERQGMPIVFEGISSATKFFYADARATLGHYLEYVWMHPDMWTALGGR